MRLSCRLVPLRAIRPQLVYSARFGNFVQPKTARLSLSTAVVDGSIPLPASPPPPPQQPSQSKHDGEHKQDADQILREAVASKAPRHDWTREQISAIYHQPLMELAYQAVSITTTWRILWPR